MEINQSQARRILWCMGLADDECRLHSSSLALAVELAKFSMGESEVAAWQKRHDEEKEEEDYYAAQEEA